jgi:hypothetical protein
VGLYRTVNVLVYMSQRKGVCEGRRVYH